MTDPGAPELLLLEQAAAFVESSHAARATDQDAMYKLALWIRDEKNLGVLRGVSPFAVDFCRAILTAGVSPRQ